MSEITDFQFKVLSNMPTTSDTLPIQPWRLFNIIYPDKYYGRGSHLPISSALRKLVLKGYVKQLGNRMYAKFFISAQGKQYLQDNNPTQP